MSSSFRRLDHVRQLLQPQVDVLFDGLISQLQDLRREGETRVRLRSLQRDLDHFWIRLGKTAFRLEEAGELQHPGLEKAMERIRAIEEEMRSIREDKRA